MQHFVRLMLLVLALALAAPFFLRGPEGRPLMELGTVWADVRGAFQRVVARLDAGVASKRRAGQPVAIHRWQDENGAWHYSDEPPPQGGGDVMLIDPDVNVMDAPPANPVRTPTPRAETPNPNPTPAAVSLPAPFSVSPDRIETLIDDTRGIEDTLQQRDRRMETGSRE